MAFRSYTEGLRFNIAPVPTVTFILGWILPWQATKTSFSYECRYDDRWAAAQNVPRVSLIHGL